jgi:Tfp pilus assembly protein PilN
LGYRFWIERVIKPKATTRHFAAFGEVGKKMANINFVPDDYVQNNESSRANVMCLVLFFIVMAGLWGSFVTIKIRQRACDDKEKLVNTKMMRLQESLGKFEQLQTKRKTMVRTALTTAELLESVPKSVLLASLTNNLPSGVSLLKVGLVQKEPAPVAQTTPANKYQAAQADKAGSAQQSRISNERLVETSIDISGMAPSDVQVAAYIEQLSSSSLLSTVALVESKEHKLDEATFREFKLKAMLEKDVHLTKQDIEGIRVKAEQSAYRF